MVLKKPYAFLIKHFKLLHLILAGLMIYLSIRINLITSLFDKLASNVSISLIDLSEKYINVFMYLSVFAIFAISFIIWFLMKNKEKPTKHYLFTMIYYCIMFIFLVIYGSAMSTVENVAMTNQALRAYSDISLLLPLGQYYFIVMSIIRGIGFNIKQFNFSKDIKELEISDEDSEEIEINLSSNAYKYGRFGRKRLRELKYYFFENKYWIMIILGSVLIIGIVYFFINYKFVNNNYSQGTRVNANSYNFVVNKTYVAETDLYGEQVRKDKKYVIVDFNIRNRYFESRMIEVKNFILVVGNDYYYPITSKNSSFEDLGLPYDNKFLDLESDYNYILIYEIDKKESTGNMKLKVYSNMNYETGKSEFVNINLKPIKLNSKQTTQTKKLNDNIIVDKNNFGSTELNFIDYTLINNFEYNYELCIKNECSEKTGVIIPNDIINKKLLVLNYNLLIDKESNLYKFIKTDDKFFNIFLTLSYNLNGDVKNIKFNGLTNTNIKNKVFMEVSKEIENATEINIIVNTRDNKYIYKLK